jgi:hypothetical protein
MKLNYFDLNFSSDISSTSNKMVVVPPLDLQSIACEKGWTTFW